MTNSPTQFGPLLLRVLQYFLLPLRRFQIFENDHVHSVHAVQDAAGCSHDDFEALGREWSPQLELECRSSAKTLKMAQGLEICDQLQCLLIFELTTSRGHTFFTPQLCGPP